MELKRFLDIRTTNLPENRRLWLRVAALLIAATAALDWWTTPYFSLQFLYVVPIILVAGFLPRWQVVALSLVCSFLGERFSSLPPADAWTRFTVVAIAFGGTGLFVSELGRNRQLALGHLAEIEEQVHLRKGAEDELQMLVDTSPAAILTADADGRIVLCNRAALRLLSTDGASLAGRPVGDHLPGLQLLARPGGGPSFRTTMQTRARRSNGELFLAAAWVSTYEAVAGKRLAAIVVDLSDELRDREDLSLDHLLKNARILAGAMSHEIRNVCGAVGVVHQNLSRVPGLVGNQDFEALGTLVDGLKRIASFELQPFAESAGSPVDLASVLEDLRVVAEPQLLEAGIAAEWPPSGSPPVVLGDRYALLQVFLNVINNARRALEGTEEKRLRVSWAAEGASVVVRFENSGPGVSAPDALFRPFQQGAEATGLGLYVSRAMLRPFLGDLRYEPVPSGCCFAAHLSMVPERS